MKTTAKPAIGADPAAVWIRFRWDDEARRLAIEPDARMKKWPGGARIYQAQLVGSAQNPGGANSTARQRR